MAELNDHHQAGLHNYMRFTRYLKVQRLRAVDACFKDVQDSRLLEETYTRDEVVDVLKELAQVVRADVDSEFINMAHSNALLLQNIFKQAEQWHLKLIADTADLENRELLGRIKEFEEEESQLKKTEQAVNQSPSKSRLQPMNETGAIALLQQEIDRLQQENSKLRGNLKMLESKTSEILGDRSKLTEELGKKKEELNTVQSVCTEQYDKEVTELQQQLIGAKEALGQLQISASKQHDLESNLTSVKHQLLEVKAQLESAEKELEKKLNQATAYLNLKKILLQKNEAIKTLRQKLARYEPDVADTEEE